MFSVCVCVCVCIVCLLHVACGMCPFILWVRPAVGLHIACSSQSDSHSGFRATLFPFRATNKCTCHTQPWEWYSCTNRAIFGQLQVAAKLSKFIYSFAFKDRGQQQQLHLLFPMHSQLFSPGNSAAFVAMLLKFIRSCATIINNKSDKFE